MPTWKLQLDAANGKLSCKHFRRNRVKGRDVFAEVISAFLFCDKPNLPDVIKTLFFKPLQELWIIVKIELFSIQFVYAMKNVIKMERNPAEQKQKVLRK